MSWLVDTNVVSEVRRGPRCHPAVAAWWAGTDEQHLFLSVLTLGEIRRGCEALRPRDPRRSALLETWLAEVTRTFGSRVLGVNARVAEIWGVITASRTVPVIDALLAATAQVHGLTLVTRNTGDMQGLGSKLLNPFVT